METSTKVEVTPARKKNDRCSLCLASVIAILLGALCLNSIALSVKVHDMYTNQLHMKSEIDQLKQAKCMHPVDEADVQLDTPVISQELLEAAIKEAEQTAANSVYPQVNPSSQKLFQELLQIVPVFDDKIERNDPSQEQLSKHKRSISEDLSVPLNECFSVVRNLQLLIFGQVKLINVLSDQVLQDISSIDDRTSRLNASLEVVSQELMLGIAAVNNSLFQQQAQFRQDISELDTEIQQVNSSLSMQQMQDRQDILELDTEIQQVNASFSMQQMQDRQDISELETEIQQVNASFAAQQMQDRQDITELDTEIQQVNDNIQQINASTTLSLDQIEDSINQVNVSLCEKVDALTTLAEQTIERLEVLGQLPTFPARSCAALLDSLPSGDYYVQNVNGLAVRVFCDMDMTCGSITGGWQRVVDLDFSNPTVPCPSNFEPSIITGTCTSTSTNGGCFPVEPFFSTSDVPYSQVCGSVIGFQINRPDAFQAFNADSTLTLDSRYLDGVSLTYGDPRKHIWSFAAGISELNTGQGSCPCNGGSASMVPDFVDAAYFCESGNPNRIPSDFTTFPNDPLWDGQSCGVSESSCCISPSPPLFFRELDQSTIEFIEMRLCRSFSTSNEDTPIRSVELYVRLPQA